MDKPAKNAICPFLRFVIAHSLFRSHSVSSGIQLSSEWKCTFSFVFDSCFAHHIVCIMNALVRFQCSSNRIHMHKRVRVMEIGWIKKRRKRERENLYYIDIISTKIQLLCYLIVRCFSDACRQLYGRQTITE